MLFERRLFSLRFRFLNSIQINYTPILDYLRYFIPFHSVFFTVSGYKMCFSRAPISFLVFKKPSFAFENSSIIPFFQIHGLKSILQYGFHNPFFLRVKVL
jgi:hypothetical protein